MHHNRYFHALDKRRPSACTIYGSTKSVCI
nr:MAG TPA: hypothetical protein [Caudoviricetes sp.]